MQRKLILMMQFCQVPKFARAAQWEYEREINSRAIHAFVPKDIKEFLCFWF
jgi:hypothetical protein